MKIFYLESTQRTSEGLEIRSDSTARVASTPKRSNVVTSCIKKQGNMSSETNNYQKHSVASQCNANATWCRVTAWVPSQPNELSTGVISNWRSSQVSKINRKELQIRRISYPEKIWFSMGRYSNTERVNLANKNRQKQFPEQKRSTRWVYEWSTSDFSRRWEKVLFKSNTLQVPKCLPLSVVFTPDKGTRSTH